MKRGFEIGGWAALLVSGAAGCGDADRTWTMAPPGVPALTHEEPSAAAQDVLPHAERSGSALDGLTLRLAGGATVSVPPGALASGVTLDLQQLDAAALPALLTRLSLEREPASPAYVLTPHGT